MWLFCYVNFERNYDILNLKSPFILLIKNINFNKNGTESKIENSKQGFRETKLVCFSSHKNRKSKVQIDELKLTKKRAKI